MQYRNTRQRKIVLEAVQEHHDHPSADQIYLEIRTKDPRISRGTVYRNLNILSGEGQITHVKVPGADRYDCRTDFHYHLICTDCGAVCDAPFSYDPTPDKTIAAESGYRMTLKNGKKSNVAKTAVARELACFIWGMMTEHYA